MEQEQLNEIMAKDLEATFERMQQLHTLSLKEEKKYLRVFYWVTSLMYLGLCTTLLYFDLHRALSWYYYWVGFSIIFLLSMIWRQLYFNGRDAHYRDLFNKEKQSFIQKTKDNHEKY